ncbi:MAG: hypothetical protein WBA57_21460 [Elainellaceae cyanobacterium]
MPKSRHSQRGEQKTESLTIRMTPTAKRGLQAKAHLMGISIADLIEQIARGDIPSMALSGELLAS